MMQSLSPTIFVISPDMEEKKMKPYTLQKSDDILSEILVTYDTDAPIRVLQLTDMQIISLNCTRNPTRDRQIKGAYFKHGVYGMEERTYAHVRALVQQVQPDLILLTGDNVYGEFDDAGLMMRELIDLMEGFGIPWAPVFGNHDNESRMGVNWQCKQLEDAPHCLFARGCVTGNSNYVIYLKKEGKLYFEIGHDQGAEVSELLKQAGFKEIHVVKDYAGLDRVVYATL
jgi:hypothetical protein